MKILIIEDELVLAESIETYLSGSGFICQIASTVMDALEKISFYDYDCILLDLMLPDGDGFKVLQELKQNAKTDGVIIISAKDTLATRIEGLNLGADDFLAKPFHLSELLARVHAIVRRKMFNGIPVITFNEIEIDLNAKSVRVNHKDIDLTRKEYDLLLYLFGNRNKVLSKAAIAEHLSGDMADMLDNHDFVYAHMKNLKKKLNENGSVDYIKTLYGVGYKWQG
jgi:DNA-binding response OmpR family regulator